MFSPPTQLSACDADTFNQDDKL